MKKLIALSVALFSALTFSAHSAAAEETPTTGNAKILIAYYSYSGNTKEVAEAIQKITGGDLFEIKTEGSYPEEYNAMVQQAKKEINDNFRPKLTTSVADIAQYDTIFIGSPNWWGTITPQVSSFLAEYDLSGKNIIPFITHGSGGLQNTVTDLTVQCQGCNINTNAWSGYGNRTQGISGWLEELGFKK